MWVWQKNDILRTKSVLLLLIWQLIIAFVYYLIANTLVYNKAAEYDVDLIARVVAAISFLCLGTVASFVADVKFGRFKTLVSSTYVIIVSNSIIIVGMGGVFFAVHNSICNTSLKS